MPSLALTFATAVSAATIDVPGDQPTLTAAVAAASDGDTIVLAAGDFGGEPVVVVQKSLTVRGAGEGTVLPRIAVGGGASLAVEDARLPCPAATASALGASGSSLRATRIVGRDCDGGPAIVAVNSSVRIEDATFDRWSAPAGPVAVSSGGTLALVGVVARDTAAVGGGAWFDGRGLGGVLASDGDDAVTIEGCAFEGASAEGEGGAVYVVDALGPVTVTDSAISDVPGGAVWIEGAARVEIDGARFVGNGTPDRSAALQVMRAPATIRRTLFCDDAGTTADLALYDAGGSTVTATAFVRSRGRAVYVAGGSAAIANAAVVDGTAEAIVASIAELDVRNVAFADLGAVAVQDLGATAEPTGGWNAWQGATALTAGTAWDVDALGQGTLADTAPGFAGDPASCTFDALRLAAGSALVDAGDPALTDPDGSRSDIGPFGGPDALPALDPPEDTGDAPAPDDDCGCAHGGSGVPLVAFLAMTLAFRRRAA